jgi:hypothetical protein
VERLLRVVAAAVDVCGTVTPFGLAYAFTVGRGDFRAVTKTLNVGYADVFLVPF